MAGTDAFVVKYPGVLSDCKAVADLLSKCRKDLGTAEGCGAGVGGMYSS